MSTTKCLYGLALLVCCCITLGTSLRCYTCDGEKDCKSPKRYECTQLLANQTRNYLDVYYSNVPLNTTSPYYECMRDTLSLKNAKYMHKGCIYAHMKSCSYAVRPYYQQNDYKRSCYQCSNKDGCNPADRASSSMLTVLATIVMAVVSKFLWSH